MTNSLKSLFRPTWPRLVLVLLLLASYFSASYYWLFVASTVKSLVSARSIYELTQITDMVYHAYNVVGAPPSSSDINRTFSEANERLTNTTWIDRLLITEKAPVAPFAAVLAPGVGLLPDSTAPSWYSVALLLPYWYFLACLITWLFGLLRKEQAGTQSNI